MVDANRIDAHQHFWDRSKTFRYEPYPEFLGVISYGWKEAGLNGLDRSFLPEDLVPQIAEVGITHTILVDALNVPGETDWMLELGDQHEFIAGVVGWVDLTKPVDIVRRNLEQRLSHPKFVGIRHLSQFEPDDDWLLRSDVIAGLGVLAELDVPYDLLVNPEQLARVPKLSEQRSDLMMVLDHLAKPYIKRGELEPWAQQMRAAAENPKLFCKLSGMITEADWDTWNVSELVPYVEVVLDAFGINRVMFGSDWPVATLAGTYRQVHDAVVSCLEHLLGTLDAHTERTIFHDSAAHFYRISL